MTKSNALAGQLFVVATPIGNLEDITLRAIRVLQTVDRIAAEDTRHAQMLLNHLRIEKPMLALHNFNERERAETLLAALQKGESIALISDAGTPLISDPGFHVVKLARDAGMKVTPIPGACAAIAALSVAGLPTDQFTFIGFLPAKSVAKTTQLQQLVCDTRTLIFYEAPHRLLATLECLQAVFAQRQIVIARELTKLFESIYQGSAAELLQHFADHADQLRGEIVILVAGSSKQQEQTKALKAEVVLDILLRELPIKQAAQLASDITGERKNKLYDLALAKK